MDYTVVYDAQRDATSLWLLVMPVFVSGFGGLMLYDILRETSRRTKQRWRAALICAYATVCVAFGVVVFVFLVREHMRDAHAPRAGFPIVEGVVRKVVRASGRSDPGAFELSPESMRTNDGGCACYRTPLPRVGLLRVGHHVRVQADGSHVLLLEIASGDVPTPLPPPRPLIPPALLWCVVPLMVFAGHGAMRDRRVWQSLATRFPGQHLEDADGYVMQQRVSVDGAGQHTLHVRLGADAFSMRHALPAGFFHDDVVIPWDAVEDVTCQKQFLYELFVVTLSEGAGQIVFHRGVGEALFEALARTRANVSA